MFRGVEELSGEMKFTEHSQQVGYSWLVVLNQQSSQILKKVAIGLLKLNDIFVYKW